MNRMDLTPFRRSTVGFDRVFDLMERQARNAGGDNYPPFNIERRGEDDYRITLAVAGFRKGDLDIVAQQNLLVVTGKKRDELNDGEMLHVGIANRGFERVANADLADGLLVIDLVREVPDAMKPKKIAIGAQQPLEVVKDDEADSSDRSAA
jgi:molecular chaperone IbpA